MKAGSKSNVRFAVLDRDGRVMAAFVEVDDALGYFERVVAANMVVTATAPKIGTRLWKVFKVIASAEVAS